ncbi:MAG: beta-propeller fold lactonase family protein, partial [Acidobacteria bacterium]|nr:beta-propeller fold lactonase family protein [Acidobacteriota bacterium]
MKRTRTHTRTLCLLLAFLAGGCVGLWASIGDLGLSGRMMASAASSQETRYAVRAHEMVDEPMDDVEATAGVAQGPTELSVDDGGFEQLVGLNQFGTIYFVNRLRPPSYPATLSQLRIYFAGGNSNLSPGAGITLLVGANPDGDENINGISFQQTGASVQGLNQFNTYSVPNLTINSGDFVVGFRMQLQANMFPGALDTTPPSRRRSYLSTNGSNFDLTEELGNVPDGNFGIRAVVNLQPAGLAALVASFTSSRTDDTGTGDLTIIRDLSNPGLTGGSIFTQGVNAEVVVAPNRQYALALPTGNGNSVSVITGLDQSNPFESQVLQIGNTPSCAAITSDSTTAIVVNAFGEPVTYRIITGLPFAPSVSPLFSIPGSESNDDKSGAEDVALSPSGETAIVSLFHDDQVAVIDGVRSGSPHVRFKVNVREGPNGVAFAPDGNTAFVASSRDDSISVISGLLPGHNPFFVRRIRDDVGETPQAISLTPDGSKAVVTNTDDNTVSIFRVNGNDLDLLRTLSVGAAPAGLAISSDGRTALVANANSRTVSVIQGLDTSNPFVATTLGPSAELDTATFAERSVALVGAAIAGPILDVTPTSLTFNAVVGQGNPAPQSITIRNVGSGSFRFNISSSDPNLATVSPSSETLVGGQQQPVTVFVNNPNQVSTRQAFLTISALGAQNSPQTVIVTVSTTSPPAVLDVIPTSLTFNAVVGQGNPPAQQFTIRNVGSGSFTFSINNSDLSLVSVSPASGTVFGSQQQTVTVFVNNPNQVGTRQAFLTINAPGAQNSPRTVTVTVNTTSPPAILDVIPTSLTFNAVIGQGNPPAQQITVRNVGSGSFSFNVNSSDLSLMTVSPSGGTIFGGQ